jgi:hypothetical protein
MGHLKELPHYVRQGAAKGATGHLKVPAPVFVFL